MAKKKEVVKKEDQLPAEISDMLAEDAGLGQENMNTKDDFAIPRLAILQSNSPRAIERGEEFVEGAKPSMIIENVANECFDGEEGIVVVPLSYRRTILEWKQRGESGGGGFVADHGLKPELFESCTKNEKGAMINADGNQLVETSEYFVFLINKDGSFQPAVISMSSTQMGKSKRWNTLMDQVRHEGKRVPTFYMSYLLTTIPESNDKGSWFGWDIKKNSNIFNFDNGNDIYLAAREFKKQIDSGDVKVAEHEGEGDTVNSEDSPM